MTGEPDRKRVYDPSYPVVLMNTVIKTEISSLSANDKQAVSEKSITNGRVMALFSRS